MPPKRTRSQIKESEDTTPTIVDNLNNQIHTLTAEVKRLRARVKILEAEALLHVKSSATVIEALDDMQILYMISYLNKRSLVSLSQVSKRFNQLALDCNNRVWQSLNIYRESHVIRMKLPRYRYAKRLFISNNDVEDDVDYFSREKHYFDVYFIKHFGDVGQRINEIRINEIPKSLEFICFRRGSISKHIAWSILREQTNLKELAMEDFEYTLGQIIICLPNPCQLVSIYVTAGYVTDDCLNTILKSCPNLKDLIMFEIGSDAHDNDDDDDDDDETHYVPFSNSGLCALLDGLSHSLVRLELGGSWNRSYERLNGTMFPKRQQNFLLKEVCFGNLKSIDELGLRALIRYGPNIEKLILEGSGLTKEGFLSSIGSLLHLSYLDIRDSEEAFKYEDMSPLGSVLPSIRYLGLNVYSPDITRWEEETQYVTDCEIKFRESCGHPVDLLIFQYPMNLIRAGRQHSRLSWIENQMEEVVDDYPASEEHPLNSLQDLDNCGSYLEIEGGKFLELRERNGCHCNCDLKTVQKVEFKPLLYAQPVISNTGIEVLGYRQLLYMISYLNKRSLVSLSQVSKRFNQLALDCNNRVWQSLNIYRESHVIRMKLPRYRHAKRLFISNIDEEDDVDYFSREKHYFDVYFIKHFGNIGQRINEIPKSLEFICFRRGSISKHIAWSILREQTNLKELAMEDFEYTLGQIIICLPNPCQLVSIYVTGGYVTDDCLNTILKSCPNLKDLIMFEIGSDHHDNDDDHDDDHDDDDDDETHYVPFSNSGLCALLDGLSHSLVRLELGGSWNRSYERLNGTMFPKRQQNFSLKEVCFGNLKSIDELGLRALIRYGPNIEKLILEGSGLTKEGFLSSIGSLLHLTYLDIRDSEEAFTYEDMSPLGSVLPSIRYLGLNVYSPDITRWEEETQYVTDCEIKFRESCGHPVDLLIFQYPMNVIRAGRQHSRLSWIENHMEEVVDDYPASEEHPLNSLQDLDKGGSYLEIEGGKFLELRERNGCHCNCDLKTST